MNIRRAEEKDMERIEELLLQVCLVHQKGRPDLFRVGTKYNPEQLRAIIHHGQRPILVAVDESMRGQKIGKRLYEAAVALARESGCYNLTLNVWSCNEGAMRFYASLGLKPQKVGMELIL